MKALLRGTKTKKNHQGINPLIYDPLTLIYSISHLQIDIQLVFQTTAIVHVYLPAHIGTKIFKLIMREREREREREKVKF